MIHQDPRVFLEGLVASVRFRFPNFGEGTQARLNVVRDVGREASHIIGCLTGEIYRGIPEYLAIILEDYHFVENSDLSRQLWGLFLDRAPSNCHIIISSRTSIELPVIWKLVSRREVASLGKSDLSFTPSEVKQWLAAHYHFQLSDAEVDKVTADSEGWIIGILLSAQGLYKGRLPRVEQGLSREAIFRYLASEVYQRQPAYIRTFLLSSSIISEQKAEFCDRLLGLISSGQLLQEIERRNLFITRLEAERVSYRYHSLFREFLDIRLILGRQICSIPQYGALHYESPPKLEQQ